MDYLQGKENFLIRLYFYINNGLNVLNNFRNLGLGVFAIYFAMKLTNPLYLVGMFFASLPVLIVVGYYNVHRAAKVSEWLNMKFGTHYGIKQYALMEETVKVLKDIRDK